MLMRVWPEWPSQAHHLSGWNSPRAACPREAQTARWRPLTDPTTLPHRSRPYSRPAK